MEKQFAASEVRREAQVWTGSVRRMLHAYADHLEADEKAEALAKWEKSHYGDYPVVIWCTGYRAKIGDKLYLRPKPAQDAERLAGALRAFPEDPNPFTYRRCYANARAALAAHSAQLQAPDGCTESNCARCNTHPDHRGDMQHAGIGSYPVGPTQDQPQAQTDGLHMVTAEEDAAVFGIGFEVDGRRVAPDRVRIFRGEQVVLQPAASVTDEMVDAALTRAVIATKESGIKGPTRYMMRAALEAALAAQENPND